MKTKSTRVLLFLLFLGTGAFYLIRFTSLFRTPDTPANLLNPAFSEQVVGYFDLRDTLQRPIAIQSVSIWLHSRTTEKELAAVFAKLAPGKDLLLTIATGEEAALKKMADGSFDEALETLCHALPGTHHVYLRWNPDMEVPVKRFSWQYQAPADYIRAFRHMVQTCRRHRPGVKIMWSPAGYPGTEEYWPGADVVDVTGLSMNGLSEREATAYPPEPDRKEALRRKLLRLRFMPKPVFVLASGGGQWQPDLGFVAGQLRKDAVLIYLSEEAEPVPARPGESMPVLGVYDPRGELTGSASVGAEHLFVDLGAIQSGQFSKELGAVIRRGHQAIVTVEPWRDTKIRKDTSVLRNTVNGVYDEEFRTLFRAIAAVRQIVYVRFAHEMEIPVHRYSWQSQDPVLYIKAFRHFMQLGTNVPNVRKVWGPAGDRGSMEWYPGGDAVDLVSIAIYGLPDKNMTDPSQQESFETIFRRKVWRMRFASKPLFITEFGVKGPDDFQSQWMDAAARVLAAHKEVVGACYFNLADNPEVWGNIPAPDWGISRETFDHFVRVLRENH